MKASDFKQESVDECKKIVKDHHKKGKNVTPNQYEELAKHETLPAWKFYHIKQSIYGVRKRKAPKPTPSIPRPTAKASVKATANAKVGEEVGGANMSISGTHDEVLSALTAMPSFKGTITVTLI